mmetsp:Transcript_1604/g.2474  ORF Transcript_1604/g.2474 Transcript_1604/m.2474 type:complete len:299 (-) Transcript_1604:286-1182(-)
MMLWGRIRNISATSSSRSSSSRRTITTTIQLLERKSCSITERSTCRYRLNLNTSSRSFSSARQQQQQDYNNARIASYLAAVTIGVVGATYASVPLYKMFCQATGYGGTTQRVEWEPAAAEMTTTKNAVGKSHANTWTDEEASEKLASLKPNLTGGRLIRVCFDSTIGDVLPWTFVPAQASVKVVPGETALCFFTTTNHSDKAITGVATYNVYPPKAGLYFNKIQCFCFEEQRLLPGETVDMPVFFYIDPDYESDAALKRCNNITLSYTFFQTDVDEDDVVNSSSSVDVDLNEPRDRAS